MTRPSLGSAVIHANRCGIKRSMVADRPTLLTCSLCPKSFSTKRGLSLHQRRKHTVDYMAKTITVALKPARRNKVSTMTMTLNSGLSHLDVAPATVPPVNVLRPAIIDALRGLDHSSLPLNPLTSTASTVNRFLKKWMKKLAPAQPKRLLVARPRRSLAKLGAKVRGRQRYRSMQKAWVRNRKDVARGILDGGGAVECTLKAHLLMKTYRNIWEKPDVFRGLGQFGLLPLIDNGPLCVPISPAEVLSVLKKIKPQGAAGPDGIKRPVLLRCDQSGKILSCIFNGILVTGVFPACLKGSRTTLIPKSTDPSKLADIGNWRPLTISSIICRAFSGILTNRLAEVCRFHPRQRGFIASPGCAENLAVLGGIIRASKRKLLPLAVVFIDFAKAFDSVSHQHIAEVLLRTGVDEHLRDLIRDSYRNCFTTVKTGKTATKPIQIKVGVKQGDPLSPLLFNLAIDPLLRTLDVEGCGFKIGGHSVTSFAFADDLVLVSDSWIGMDKNLRILEKFSEMTGLEVNPTKCHSFMISISGRRYEINNCEQWKLKDAPIDLVGGDAWIKYLGVRINPLKGILLPSIREELSGYIERISSAPLKPTQKLLVLHKYAIPRILYAADHGMAGTSILAGCDRDIRMAVKRWLHLDPCTTDSLLYSACKDGGLGLLRLVAMVPIMQSRRMVSLIHSEDTETRLLVRELVADKEVLSVWKRACKAVGASLDPDLVPTKESLPIISSTSWRKYEFSKWMRHKMQGVGIDLFWNDKISNHWLPDPGRFRLREFETLLALRLRSSTFQTRTFSRLGRSWLPATCSLCDYHNETIRHLVGCCPELKPNRMRSHNRVCLFLTGVAESLGWLVHREPHLIGPRGKLGVPDMVMVKGPNALIVDVTIAYESAPDTLAKAAAAKVQKYTFLKSTLIALNPGVRAVNVYGFPMGARGKWFHGNMNLLSDLGIGKTRAVALGKTFSRLVLLQTIDLVKAYRRLTK